MLKDLFTHRLFISTLALFLLMFVGSRLYLNHVKHETQQELALSEASAEEALKRLEARNEKTPLDDTVTAKDTAGEFSDTDDTPATSDGTGALPIDESTESHLSSDPATDNSAASEAARKEWIARRNELDQKLDDLAKEGRLLSEALLKSTGDELSLMYSSLRKLPTAQRKMVHQVLLKMHPDDADSLNDFFHDIDQAPTRENSEISERAKEILSSREAMKIASRQLMERHKQLGKELSEFYGESWDQGLEQIRREHGR